MSCFGGLQWYGRNNNDYTLLIGIMRSGRRSLRGNILVGGCVLGWFWLYSGFWLSPWFHQAGVMGRTRFLRGEKVKLQIRQRSRIF